MKVVGAILIFFLLLFLNVKPSFAIYDPTSVPNNKFGVHILFPDEIFDAQKLINSQGGDWGYVTIPIQSSDKDLVKWQKFMDEAKTLRVIPIIRLSTTGDYFNTSVWGKPKFTDIVDFANFLNSLNWPTKNRYIVIYNEVNRGDEWGGSPNPFEYADILDFAVNTFKERSPDFFVISAGLDNAAPNIFGQYMNEYDFMRGMSYEIPDIFEKIDGIASHSYPNPGFSQSPEGWGVYSFKKEQALAEESGQKALPVFITETGWSNDILSQNTIANYYKDAFENTWSDKNIVAVTPFILRAGGEFSKFSLILPSGLPSDSYNEIESISKVRGGPRLPEDKEIAVKKVTVFPEKTFKKLRPEENLSVQTKKIAIIFKWLLGL